MNDVDTQAAVLINKFLGCQTVRTVGTTTVQLLPPDREEAKRCALVAAELLIDESDFPSTGYWQDVKESILKAL